SPQSSTAHVGFWAKNRHQSCHHGNAVAVEADYAITAHFHHLIPCPAVDLEQYATVCQTDLPEHRLSWTRFLGTAFDAVIHVVLYMRRLSLLLFCCPWTLKQRVCSVDQSRL